jgi:hypothetical protein
MPGWDRRGSASPLRARARRGNGGTDVAAEPPVPEISPSSLARDALGTLYLLLPLLGGAVLHGLCMRTGWLGFLTRPIDGGRSFRGEPLFGKSKTWRGPILVAGGAALVWVFQRSVLHHFEPLAALELVDYTSLPGWWFGAVVGAAAELSELPNSFVKRQLGIAPGGTARGLRAAIFYLWDQLDLLLGFWLAFAVVLPVTPARIVTSVLIVGGIHPLVTLAGYLLGMRPTAR